MAVERLDHTDPRVSGVRRLSPRILLLMLLVSLPLVNPWVRGDGVGYYAFARALLIQHNLDFTADYQHANEGFREARLDTDGKPKEIFRTSTGHLENHFTVGPAMLWAPLLIFAHIAVLAARVFGASVAADGFSLPYVLAMALGTVLCGFLALILSYRVACHFVAERWALLATIAVWWASSLPVYMYFNPSWSHAHSAFVVALFFWYWLRTRESRTTVQWIVLALIAGLALNVYYPNVLILAALVPEVVRSYQSARKDSPEVGSSKLFWRHALFCAITLLSLLPTFLTKYFIYGGPFETGYISVSQWNWLSPSFLALLFSANHGLFSWTPILMLAVIGLVLFVRKFRTVGVSVLCVILPFYYFMASYPDWPGISSYGNRFFISLTVFFVLGLATLFESIAGLFRSRALASACLSFAMCFFIAWNLGLIFQWGAHLIPARGPVSWRQVTRNQFNAVPRQMASQLHNYLFRRKAMLHQIEQRDIQQLGHPVSQ